MMGAQLGREWADAGFGHRLARRAGAALILVSLLPGASPVGRLDVEIGKLRSEKGMLRLCLTADPDNFPGCLDDKNAVTRSVAASERSVRFDGLSGGRYALSVIHDENGNAKLDTFAGIPREGFGFSRNPAIRFGPPRFSSAQFELATGTRNEQDIRIRYMF